MRKLMVAAAMAATLAMGGAFAWQASAATPAAPVPVAVPSAPVHQAACVGRNVDCPPGQHRVCGPEGHRCWCAPC